MKVMAAMGIRHADLASIFEIGEATLENHYGKELHDAAQKANGNVAKSLYQNAMSGNVAAQIWWTKARMGWRETQGIEHSGNLPLFIQMSEDHGGDKASQIPDGSNKS